MFPQKFEKGGKKFVRFEVGGEVVEAELAPREVVDEIISRYEIPPSAHQVDIKLDKKEAQPNEKINLSGWFSESDEGKYRVMLWLYDLNRNAWKWGHIIGEVEIKKEQQSKIVDASEIYNAIKNSFGERMKNADIRLADTKYYLADVNKLVKAIRQAKVAEMSYEAEWFDCDDFSFRAMGVWHGNKELARMACFIVWVWWKSGDKAYAHALNAAYDGQFRLVEPQNYRVFLPPENWNLMLVMG